MVALADDYTMSAPTTPGIYTDILVSSISPVNRVILMLVLLGWLFIILDSHQVNGRLYNEDSVPGNDAPEVPGNLMSVEEIEKFGENQTFESGGQNYTSVFDTKKNVLMTDDGQSTLSCYLFNVNCPVGQRGRAIGKKFNIKNGIVYEEAGTRRYSFSLSDAMKQGMCKDMSREDASTFLCDRGLDDAYTLNKALTGADICTHEVDPSNCGVWKQCVYNIAKEHYSTKNPSWFFNMGFCLDKDCEYILTSATPCTFAPDRND